jgi:hypothetical protein
MITSNLFVVNIKGGFGNQLFQYNFAKHLRDHGFKVKIDNSFFISTVNKPEVTNRKEILNCDLFGFEKINKYENYLIKKLILIGEKKRFKFFSTFYKKRIFNTFKEKNFNILSKFPRIVYCDGYWQDLDFMNDDANFIKSNLIKIPTIKEALTKSVLENSFMLIVRRGDYIKMEQDLKLDYYKQCIEIANNLANKPIINVFTDDVHWVKEQKIFNDVNSITGPEEDADNVTDLFSKMIQNKNYFVGNSTFSFFAALVGKSGDSKVYVAEPWFRNRETKNLLHPEWLRIKNN